MLLLFELYCLIFIKEQSQQFYLMKGQQQYQADWSVNGDDRKSGSLKLGISYTLNIKQQQMPNYSLQVEREFDSAEVSNLQEQQLDKELEKIRNKMHFYQQKINRKIDKYFPQLRPQPIQKTQTAESMMESLKNEIELRNRLIQFQLAQIKEIIEKQKQLDSKERIEFAIPLEISDTKKKIEEIERFIHVAGIRQKKKSEDLVKVDKKNLHQFQHTALLRTNLEVSMLYQINLNEREAKIDDHIYDFNKKLVNLDKKLQQLGLIVQERHIPVSSNKNLLVLKQKKAVLTKCRDNENKKIMLANASIKKNTTNLNREIQKMRQELKEKQQRYETILLQCQQLQQKSKYYLKDDEDLGKSLRKSISFNYAQTLLKMKKNSSVVIQHQKQVKIEPVKSVLFQKPNFKIRKNMSANHSSLEKHNSLKKDSNFLNQINLPITHNLSKRAIQNVSLPNPELKNSQKQRRVDIIRNKPRKKSQAQYIIDQY